MARPRRWECGEGVVSVLVPDVGDLLSFQEGLLDIAAYRYRYVRQRSLGLAGLAPGKLFALTPLDPVPVEDGDTLLCACGVAAAREGRCHRTWAASLLLLGGWDIVLDQKYVSKDTAQEWRGA